MQASHPGSNAVAWGILFLSLGGVFARAAVPSEEDYYANSLTSAQVLQRWYNDKGLWDSTGWWNAANCLEAIESVVELTNGEQDTEVIRSTFDRNSSGNFLNEFYDDEGWWALAWIRAFDLTGEARYLEMAKTIFADMKGGWDEHCGGGIWWKKDDRYKNAIANELFLLVAIRLHQRTPGDAGAGSYLDWAQREWAWFKQSGMINQNHLVNDGLTDGCENNGRTTWTYNQGVIIGGLVELYKTTGDTNCLAQAVAIGDAAIATLVDANGILCEPNEPRGLRGADGPQFKGIFIRHLAELYEATGKPAYREFLVRNARSVWRNNRDAANRFGGRWAGPVDAVDAARHSSAMRVITALAGAPRPETHVLPKSFRIWAAHPGPDQLPGHLVTGPGDQGLPPGDYEAEFEFKVDNFSRDNSPVATISVVNLETQRIEAGRELKRGDFPNVLYQKFGLRFPSAGGQRYGFRTEWHQSPNAPRLTQRSVTVKPAFSKR